MFLNRWWCWCWCWCFVLIVNMVVLYLCFRISSCCYLEEQQMWTWPDCVQSSASPTATAVQRTYSIGSRGKETMFYLRLSPLSLSLSSFLPSFLPFRKCGLEKLPPCSHACTICMSADALSLSFSDGSGQLYRKWHLFSVNNCSTSALAALCCPPCPIGGTQTKVSPDFTSVFSKAQNVK